jgi:hypothetical protein
MLFPYSCQRGIPAALSVTDAHQLSPHQGSQLEHQLNSSRALRLLETMTLLPLLVRLFFIVRLFTLMKNPLSLLPLQPATALELQFFRRAYSFRALSGITDDATKLDIAFSLTQLNSCTSRNPYEPKEINPWP